MAQQSIIEQICRSGVVKEIVHNIAHFDEHEEDLQDLEQDIYIILMTKDTKAIKEIYDEGHINYYIANIAYTQLRSQTSPYYTKYKKFRQLSNNIDDYDR